MNKKFKKHFRIYFKNGHPAYIVDEDGNAYVFHRVTHSKTSGGRNNIKIDNPLVKGGDQATYIVKRVEKDKKGRIWVHTGDMGYINNDGLFFFVQRLKRLIIVSGYNVFPSHIEDVLEKHEAVLSCCVVGIPHPYKIQVPKAYIVLNESYKNNLKVKKSIEEYCTKNLAKYMIPKEFEYRESLPKTMIGKVDYKKLENEKSA